MARPEKPIDWKKVDELLMADCKGTEIAPHFDMHVNTFYRKCEEEHKISFNDYSALKRCQGDSLLKYKQYEKAIKGDNTLLIWLGKCRIGQKEAQGVEINTEVLTAFEQCMKQVQLAQEFKKAELEKKISQESESNDSIDLNNNNSESKS